ncbi:MAG: hypothetical protein HFF17_06305 [Oscillospiraceae bacterium]|nr:hypothetical protein [Oscillospiraceae bacterium]
MKEGISMHKEPTPEGLEGVREAFERQTEEREPYIPRPRWQIVMAWVLFGIVVLGIINLCYWQITG